MTDGEAYRGRCEAVEWGRDALIYRTEEEVSAQATIDKMTHVPTILERQADAMA